MKIDTCYTCKYFVDYFVVDVDGFNTGFCDKNFEETHSEYCCVEYSEGLSE